MAADDVKVWYEARRDIPSLRTAGTLTPARCSLFGEPMVQALFGSKLVPGAEEGQYFHGVNATPGTGIAGHAAPTDISAYLKAFLHIRNDGTARRVIMDYVRLQVSAAGAGATTELWAARLDKGATRRTSGGTAIVPKNPSITPNNTSSTTCYTGAIVTAAETSDSKGLGSGLVRNVVPVVGDTYVWDFGASQRLGNGSIINGTAPATIVIPMPPVILDTTEQFLLHLAGASQSGAHSYEVSFGFWER